MGGIACKHLKRNTKQNVVKFQSSHYVETSRFLGNVVYCVKRMVGRITAKTQSSHYVETSRFQ